jgi:hypothetical protein
MRKSIAALSAALLAALSATAALADTPAGSAKGVNPAAAAALGGATRTLVVGSDIFIGDVVQTGAKGQVQILFADNTKLVVGPQSELKIDDYLLRNNGGSGKFVVDMLSGSFRFATGNGPKNKYELDTPTGTIGVRGTQFDVFVAPDGTTTILHYLGTVIFRAKGEKKWTSLHDACTLGQITNRAAVLGSSKTTTGDARNALKREFRYADNQSPLLRAFWFARAFDCLHNAPDISVPRTLGGPQAGPGTGTPPPTNTPPTTDPGTGTGTGTTGGPTTGGGGNTRSRGQI